MVDIYAPDFKNPASGNSVYFDGTASSTNEALVTSLSGDFDAELYIERSNDGGSTWQQTTQLTDSSGNTTFGAGWHTQGNREILKDGVRRLRVKNIDGSGGYVEAVGDEL